MSTPSVTARWRRTAAVHSGSRSGRPRCTDESTDTHMAVAARVGICPSVCPVPSCAPCPHAQTISRSGRLPSRSRRTAHPSHVQPLRLRAAPGACWTAAVGSNGHTHLGARLAGSPHSDRGTYRSRACTCEPALAASRCGGGVAACLLIVVPRVILSLFWSPTPNSISFDPPPYPTVLVGTQKQHADMGVRAERESTASFVDCCTGLDLVLELNFRGSFGEGAVRDDPV